MISALRSSYFAPATTADSTATTGTKGSTTDTASGAGTTAPNAAEPPKGAAEPSGERTTPLPENSKRMGRDEFLQLLVAQLKNQDPMNPMDGKDMAAQLAQFSSVEQLIQLNKSIDGISKSQESVATAIGELKTNQDEHAAELANLIEGQMAVSTVGKTGVTTGKDMYVERNGNGSMMIDTGSMKGNGRVTIYNEKGERVVQSNVTINSAGQQAIDLADLKLDPPLKGGKYTYEFEVATDGGQFQGVKTYTVGRITGLRYEQGSPILIIGDRLSVPMSKLTQIRG